jgi:hypothetical protein
MVIAESHRDRGRIHRLSEAPEALIELPMQRRQRPHPDISEAARCGFETRGQALDQVLECRLACDLPEA